MASSKERQRKLERARQERRIARQAAAQRRRRQIQAAVGSFLALVLIVVGTVWLLGGFESDPEPAKPTVAAGTCTWYLREPDAERNIRDTGNPPVTGETRSGTRPMTITTSQGVIETALDLEKAPCTAASFTYLAGKQYFDGSVCHRMVTTGIYVLQCGDPSGTGSGGPAYTFDTEYVPTAIAPGPSASASPSTSPSASPTASPGADGGNVIYPAGTLAMANTGEANSNGSQFFIVYGDSPLPASYTAFGRVTSGLDVVEKVAAGGTDGAFDQAGGPGGGHPKTEVRITALVVGEPTAPSSPTPSPASATPSPSASASPQS